MSRGSVSFSDTQCSRNWLKSLFALTTCPFLLHFREYGHERTFCPPCSHRRRNLLIFYEHIGQILR